MRQTELISHIGKFPRGLFDNNPVPNSKKEKKKIGKVNVIFINETSHVGNTESMLFTRLLHFLPRKFLDVLHQVRSPVLYITNKFKIWMGVCILQGEHEEKLLMYEKHKENVKG